jgi:hypothetical protein
MSGHPETLPKVPLTLSGRSLRTVFDLLGDKENDLTYSFGWALANAPFLMAGFLGDLLGEHAGAPVAISLQVSGSDRGFTDIELEAEHAHLIVEAKRGWVLPSERQLERYVGRVRDRENCLLVALTECSPAFARRLPTAVANVPVTHRTWRDVIHLAEQSSRYGTHAERRLVKEFSHYLRGVMTMQDIASNWTYCVVLSSQTQPGWGISFRDVVVEKDIYIHPYGTGGWPKTPPNYLALRWNGHVQQIRHVDECKVVTDFSEVLPGHAPAGEVDPHIAYSLGPVIPMQAPLPSGAQYRAARLWVALDLLLTSQSLKEAIAATTARKNAGLAEPG